MDWPGVWVWACYAAYNLHEAWSGVCPVRIDVYHLSTSDDKYRGVKERKRTGNNRRVKTRPPKKKIHATPHQSKIMRCDHFNPVV